MELLHLAICEVWDTLAEFKIKIISLRNVNYPPVTERQIVAFKASAEVHALCRSLSKNISDCDVKCKGTLKTFVFENKEAFPKQFSFQLAPPVAIKRQISVSQQAEIMYRGGALMYA